MIEADRKAFEEFGTSYKGSRLSWHVAKAAWQAALTHARAPQEPVGSDRAMYVCASCREGGEDYQLHPRGDMRVFDGQWYCTDCAREELFGRGYHDNDEDDLPLAPGLYAAPVASTALTPAEEVERLRNYCGAAHRDLEEMYAILSDEKTASFFPRSLASLKDTSEFMALASEGKEDVTAWGREIVERDEKLAVLSEALEAIGGVDEVSLVPLPDPVIRGMLYAQIRAAKVALTAIGGERP